MHWTIALLYVVVVFWVAPVALADGVALALLVAWATGEIIVRLTGDPLPVDMYFLIDAIVVCYLAGIRQFLPRAILALYPLQWAIYALVETPRTQWFWLWGVTLVQFVLAGWHGRLQRRRNDLGTMVQERRPVDSRVSPAVPIDLDARQALADGSLDRKFAPYSGIGKER